MTSDAVMAPETRLYGNWRRARGFGIGQLGTGQTLTVFGVVIAPILAAYVSPRAALVLGLLGAVIVGLVVVRIGGSMVRDYVARRSDPHAPPAAQEVMAQLVAATPATGADVDTRVSITFDPNRATPRPKSVLEAVAEVTRWLPGLETALGAAGVAVLGRASIEWLTSRLRIAYDPAARPDVLLGAEPQLTSWAITS